MLSRSSTAILSLILSSIDGLLAERRNVLRRRKGAILSSGRNMVKYALFLPCVAIVKGAYEVERGKGKEEVSKEIRREGLPRFGSARREANISALFRSIFDQGGSKC